MEYSLVSTRIKVCGITSAQDGLEATASGIDVLGLVFYKKSPRHVSIEQAKEIARVLPPFTCLVGLFVNASEHEVKAVLNAVPLGLIQFHGSEPEAFCNQWGVPYIKAFRVRPEESVAAMVAPYHSASGYLLDSYQPGTVGGTGESFDWGLIPESLDKPVILAGGLNPDNVQEAIKAVNPYAVDVSSGVEQAPGVKDSNKIKAFIKAAGR